MSDPTKSIETIMRLVYTGTATNALTYSTEDIMRRIYNPVSSTISVVFVGANQNNIRSIYV